jgi:hypothetical protein
MRFDDKKSQQDEMKPVLQIQARIRSDLDLFGWIQIRTSEHTHSSPDPYGAYFETYNDHFYIF